MTEGERRVFEVPSAMKWRGDLGVRIASQMQLAITVICIPVGKRRASSAAIDTHDGYIPIDGDTSWTIIDSGVQAETQALYDG